MIDRLLPSRLTVIVAVICLVAVPLSVVACYQWGVTHRDFVRLDNELNAPITGIRDQLTTCQIDKASAQNAIANQNARLDALTAEGEKAKAAAAAKVSEAQAKQRQAERRAYDLLAAQRRDGESACDAAFRIIKEQVQ